MQISYFIQFSEWLRIYKSPMICVTAAFTGFSSFFSHDSLPYSPITAPSLILLINSVTPVAAPSATMKTIGTIINPEMPLPYLHTNDIKI